MRTSRDVYGRAEGGSWAQNPVRYRDTQSSNTIQKRSLRLKTIALLVTAKEPDLAGRN